MCDKPSQLAHFRVRKDWVISPHPKCHGWLGIAPLRLEEGGGKLKKCLLKVLIEQLIRNS